MESSARAPDGYAGVFEAAKQRDLLVHLYMEIDDRKVFASLASLDDLRRFAAIVANRID